MMDLEVSCSVPKRHLNRIFNEGLCGSFVRFDGGHGWEFGF